MGLVILFFARTDSGLDGDRIHKREKRWDETSLRSVTLIYDVFTTAPFGVKIACCVVPIRVEAQELRSSYLPESPAKIDSL